MRIYDHTPIASLTRISAASAQQADPVAATPADTATRRVDQVDFTDMTRRDLLDWMNGRIRSGELSLDDTSGLLGMTMRMPVGGGSAGPDATEKVDFMAMASGGIGAALARGDKDGAEALRTALSVMRNFQGSIAGLDITA